MIVRARSSALHRGLRRWVVAVLAIIFQRLYVHIQARSATGVSAELARLNTIFMHGRITQMIRAGD